MSSIQDTYEQISYPHYVHPLTDPARLAALGRILGLNVAKPDAARVLDIGCGSGTNLLAMAERLPGSQFLGIDFVAAEIDSARAIAAEAGLKNVRFVQADLLDWESNGEKYDYIIAYGLFSWVPDEVKDRLLEVCRQCLAPNGLACISYMTYPGCKQSESLRDLLRLRTEGCHSPDEKVASSHQVLNFLERAYDQLPNQSHASHLGEVVRQIRRKEPHFLLLDELGVERDPCYLIQFANWAAEHQLRYVGENEFHMMFLENLPLGSAKELAAMELDRLETEQMIDFVVNRSFRCSLLVHNEVPESRGLNTKALEDLSFKPLLVPDNIPELNLEESRFRTKWNSCVTLRSAPLVAFCRAMATRLGSYTPFADVLSVAQTLAARTFVDAEVSQLREDLLTLFVRRQLDISALAFTPPHVMPLRPKLSTLNRAAARSRSLVMTVNHEACRINLAEQAFCELLDGNHEREDLLRREIDGNSSESFLVSLANAGCLETEF